MIQEVKAYKAEDGTLCSTRFDAAIRNKSTKLFNFISLERKNENKIFESVEPKELIDFLETNANSIVEIFMEEVVLSDPQGWIDDIGILHSVATKDILEGNAED